MLALLMYLGYVAFLFLGIYIGKRMERKQAGKRKIQERLKFQSPKHSEAVSNLYDVLIDKYATPDGVWPGVFVPPLPPDFNSKAPDVADPYSINKSTFQYWDEVGCCDQIKKCPPYVKSCESPRRAGIIEHLRAKCWAEPGPKEPSYRIAGTNYYFDFKSRKIMREDSEGRLHDITKS